MASKSTSGSAGAVATQEHLLDRVGAEPEAERLERDDLLGRDVAKVHVGAEVLHEPGLRGLRRRLEEQVVQRDLVRDLLEQARAHVARLAEDPGGAALAALGDDLPGTGF